jgi:hypothetical protein
MDPDVVKKSSRLLEKVGKLLRREIRDEERRKSTKEKK